MMDDTDRPKIELKTSEDMSEASVVVTFPYLEQALEFQKIVKAMIDGMPKVISIPNNWLVDFQLQIPTRKGGFTIAMWNIVAKIA